MRFSVAFCTARIVFPHNDDGEKVLFKLANELQIDLEDNEIQRVHRLGQKRRNNENPRPIIGRFVSYKKINELLN